MQASELLQQLIDAERQYRDVLKQVQTHGAELFKAVRQEHGLTQREFADILEVDFSFISKVENGHIRPGKPVLSRLVRWLAHGDAKA